MNEFGMGVAHLAWWVYIPSWQRRQIPAGYYMIPLSLPGCLQPGRWIQRPRCPLPPRESHPPESNDSDHPCFPAQSAPSETQRLRSSFPPPNHHPPEIQRPRSRLNLRNLHARGSRRPRWPLVPPFPAPRQGLSLAATELRFLHRWHGTASESSQFWGT